MVKEIALGGVQRKKRRPRTRGRLTYMAVTKEWTEIRESKEVRVNSVPQNSWKTVFEEDKIEKKC